ncbi:MAG: hypothetical protein ACRDP7_46725 [Trebonia sp.]
MSLRTNVATEVTYIAEGPRAAGVNGVIRPTAATASLCAQMWPVVAVVIDVDDLRLLLHSDLSESHGGLVAYFLEAPSPSSSGLPNAPQAVSNWCRW